MGTRIYRYIDGNNNEYVIKGDPQMSVEYNPVKPQYSSSGIYDGGEHKKIKITNQQYNELITVLNETAAKKKVKLSGMIIIQKKGAQLEFIIKPHSREMDIIEEQLKSVMKD
jgi:hypothetical protein